jgi:hypothetical protein
MAFQDQLPKMFEFVPGSQSIFRVKAPYILAGSGNYLVGASNLTLAADDSGATLEVGAGEDYVLPSINTTTPGIRYEFLVTTTATTLTITAAAGDLLEGGVTIMSTTAGLENDAFSANGTTDLVLSMNGTTQGGIVGSRVTYVSTSDGHWLVHGNLIGSGALVTPFS